MVGIKSAPEEFQSRLDEFLEGLENIALFLDVVISFGSGDSVEEATASHDLAFKEPVSPKVLYALVVLF